MNTSTTAITGSDRRGAHVRVGLATTAVFLVLLLLGSADRSTAAGSTVTPAPTPASSTQAPQETPAQPGRQHDGDGDGDGPHGFGGDHGSGGRAPGGSSPAPSTGTTGGSQT